MATNKKHKVTAAIVTYNRLDLLKKSLKAVLSQGTNLNHVVVINNASTDDTENWLNQQAQKNKKIIVFNSKKNLGGAGGFNQAVKTFIKETNDDFVWLMDDDTIPQKDSLDALLRFAETHKPIGFINSQVRWHDAKNMPSWMNINNPRAFSWPINLNDKEPGIEVVNSSFVSVLIPRDIVLSIGLPQKEYFIWGDDIEYTNRAADIARGYMALNSIAVHESKENTIPGDIIKETDEKRLWRYDYEYRNRMLTSARVNKKERWQTLKGSLTYDLPRVVLKKGVQYRGKKIKSILKGSFQGIFFNPEIEFDWQKPKKVRSIKKIIEARNNKYPEKRLTLDEEIQITRNGNIEDYQ